VSDIGASTGPNGAGAPGNAFIALMAGSLKNASGNIGNAVKFTAKPSSTGTVEMTLPAPFDAAPFAIGGNYDLLHGLTAAGTNLSVITTFTSQGIGFSLDDYDLWPNTVTGATLTASSAQIDFKKPVISVFSPDIPDGGTHGFAGETAGYAPLTPTAFAITNLGAYAMASLGVALSGAGAADFTLSTNALNLTLPIDAATAFTLVPNTGLTAGVYTATVTITDPNLRHPYTFTVSFEVTPRPGAAAFQWINVKAIDVAQSDGAVTLKWDTTQITNAVLKSGNAVTGTYIIYATDNLTNALSTWKRYI
jgi:hypothetical protein